MLTKRSDRRSAGFTVSSHSPDLRRPSRLGFRRLSSCTESVEAEAVVSGRVSATRRATVKCIRHKADVGSGVWVFDFDFGGPLNALGSQDLDAILLMQQRLKNSVETACESA